MNTLESISYALKEERLAQGLTQKDLAQKAQVSRAWLIGLESGTARRAEFGKILDTAAALGFEFSLTQTKPLTADEEFVMSRMFDA